MTDLSMVAEVKVTYSTTVKAADRLRITNSSSAVKILRPFFEQEMEYREVVYLLLMNRSNDVLGVVKVCEGGTSAAVVDAKIIYQAALKSNAHNIILAHNHPSGNLRSSHQDDVMTQKILDAGKVLDIELLDHLILTRDGYFSYSQENKIL